MRRRDFLTSAAAATLAPGLLARAGGGEEADCCETTYASPAEAMQSPPETLLYVTAVRTGMKQEGPDYLATVDVNPGSRMYGQVVHRVEMPNVGDELHHFGWNACSSCHGDPEKMRRYIVLPGLNSGRIHILDAANPRAPKLIKVIEPE